jgi:hypothetical protein
MNISPITAVQLDATQATIKHKEDLISLSVTSRQWKAEAEAMLWARVTFSDAHASSYSQNGTDVDESEIDSEGEGEAEVTESPSRISSYHQASLDYGRAGRRPGRNLGPTKSYI